MTIKFLDLSGLHAGIGGELRDVFETLLADSAFISGKHVTAFEEAFANYVGAAHCVGVGNGTDAITIAIEALNERAGGEVIVPANSFIASSEAVTSAGCRVVFADASPDSYNLDLDDVRRRITDKTVGIMAVHLYGNPADLDGLALLCREHGLFLIEDCAQAHGATYKSRHVGNAGHAATFSFYPGKNLGALGDGGAIVANDEAVARRSRMIANHGRIAKYDHEFEGRNSRLDGLQAALLSAKLRHLDDWVAARREVAAAYDAALRSIGLTPPPVNPDGTHAYHLYVIRSAQRDALKEWLAAGDIQTGIHYPIALPALAAYQYLQAPYEDMFATTSAGELLSLPIGPHMSPADAQRVVERIAQFVPEAA